MTATLATNEIMLTVGKLQSDGDHPGAARLMLRNIGLAGRDRALWMLMAACHWFMANDMRRTKRTLGRVDPNGLHDDDRRLYERAMKKVDDYFRAKRLQAKREEGPYNVTFLKGESLPRAA